MTNARLVIFDCDGVLVDNEPISNRVFCFGARSPVAPLIEAGAHETFRAMDELMMLIERSVEATTGVFSNLPQLALTLIGSFILVLSALRAFGCVASILKGASQIAVRSLHALPQAAVLGSVDVAAVSGSGVANAITPGTATIPAMIGAGMPRGHGGLD